MHYPQRRALAIRTRNCRLLYHGWLSAQVSSARSWIKRCHNDSWAGSHVVPRILHWILTEEVEKGQILWVHTYPTTSSRRRGRRVQSSVEIGSEMWICIRSIQTKKERTKNHFIFIYKIRHMSSWCPSIAVCAPLLPLPSFQLTWFKQSALGMQTSNSLCLNLPLPSLLNSVLGRMG